MSQKAALPVVAVATAAKRTFDQGIRFTPVIGTASKKLPFSPTTAVLIALGLGVVTGGIWTVSKALILGANLKNFKTLVESNMEYNLEKALNFIYNKMSRIYYLQTDIEKNYNEMVDIVLGNKNAISLCQKVKNKNGIVYSFFKKKIVAINNQNSYRYIAIEDSVIDIVYFKIINELYKTEEEIEKDKLIKKTNCSKK